MKMKKLIALLLILALGAPAALAQEVAMGRYVQQLVKMPQEKDIARMTVDQQGRVALFIQQAEKGLSRAALGGDGTWEIEDLPWAGQVDDYGGWSAVSNIAVAGDQVYLTIYTAGESGPSYQILRGQGDQLTKMDMTHVSEDVRYLAGMAAGPDGLLVLQTYEGFTYGYDFDTGVRRASYDRVDGDLFIAQGKLYGLSKQENCALVYDTQNGELLGEMADAPMKESNALYADGDSLFLLNVGGIYRITLGGSMWEQLVDGALTDLRLPATYLQGLAVSGDVLYALVVNSERGSKLLAFTYDANVTSVPTQKLAVYTLYPSRVLEQAASVFQSSNPDYLVEVIALLGEDTGATRQDVISALNVELLAGKGPDVLLLDGMPMDSYIEKGVLADLSQVIKPMIDSGELLGNLFEPLYRGDAIYQAPTRVSLPMLMGDSGPTAWADLISGVQNGLKLPDRSLKGYVDMFLPSNYGAWFGEDGALKQEELAAFLEDIQTIYRACGEKEVGRDAQNYYIQMVGGSLFSMDLMNGAGGRIDEVIKLKDGRLDQVPGVLMGLSMSMMELSQLSAMGKGFGFLPGKAGKSYAPSSQAGVNARSAQLEAALEFVGLMLSQQVQDADLYDGGMPVNRRSFDKLVAREETQMSMATSMTDSETGESLMLESSWPDRATRERVLEMVSQADSPYAPDQTLLELTRDALEPFSLGEMDAQTAAQAVGDKVRAYLAE